MSGPHVVAVVQARTGSSRLPGKVLADLEGRPLLARVLERAGRARSLDELVLATTTLAEDDAVALLAGELGVPCFRGSAEDCLDRLYRAATASRANVVVRLTGDNPILEGELVDWAVGRFLSAEPACDYVSTALSGTFPLGLGVEVMAYGALELAWREAKEPAWREHVTPFIYKQPERFRICRLVSEPDYSHIRLTVDTPEDLTLVRRVFAHFGHDRFGWRDAVALLEQHPDWVELNRHVAQRTV